MSRVTRTGIGIVSVLAVVCFSTAALADPGYVEQGTTNGSSVTFTDPDPLAAAALGPNDARLTVPPAPKRVMLLRPRTQFVQEMLKSVENL